MLLIQLDIFPKLPMCIQTYTDLLTTYVKHNTMFLYMQMGRAASIVCAVLLGAGIGALVGMVLGPVGAAIGAVVGAVVPLMCFMCMQGTERHRRMRKLTFVRTLIRN